MNPKCANTHVSYTTTFYQLLPFLTNFYQLLPPTIKLYYISPISTNTTSTNFYHLPPTFAKFYHFLPIFIPLLPILRFPSSTIFYLYYLPPILTNFTLLFTTFHQFCDTNAFSKYYLQIKFITIFYSASNQYHNINITWQFIICFNQYFSIMKFSNAYYLFNFV